jgi:hypothetical protein
VYAASPSALKTIQQCVANLCAETQVHTADRLRGRRMRERGPGGAENLTAPNIVAP